MTIATPDYGISTDVNLPYERAVEVTKEALAQEGFGVLTEIDIRETLEAEAGRRLSALCNPWRVQPPARAPGAARRPGYRPATPVQRYRPGG